MKSFGKFLPSFLIGSFVFYFLSERAIYRYQHMGAGVDIGLFENLFYNLSHTGKAFTSLGIDGQSHHYFSDHINWFIYPIGILYHFFSHAETLLILQALILSAPIIILPTFGIQNSYKIIYPLLYALYLPIYWIQIFDFHPEVLWIPFFFFFFLFWKKQSKLWYVFFFLSLCTKEETTLIWIVFSFLIRDSHPKESRTIGIITILYMILSIFLLYYFNHQTAHYKLAHLERYVDPIGAITKYHLFPYLLLFLLFPLLFLPLRYPLSLCLFPYVLYSLGSQWEVNKTPFTHHSFITIPILFVSFIEVVESFSIPWKRTILSLSLLISILLFFQFGPITKTYSYRKDFMNREIKTDDVSILRSLFPGESIVSNVPQYLAYRSEVFLFLPNKEYSAKYFVYYQGKDFPPFEKAPIGYEQIFHKENHILIFQHKKID